MVTGQIVKFLPGSGMEEIPAIVTRVWNDTMVNLTTFPDGMMPQCVTSVPRATYPNQGFSFREIV